MCQLHKANQNGAVDAGKTEKDENIEKVETDPKIAELYLGGKGAAAKILWEKVPPAGDPFSPDNLLTFSAGLLHGPPVPGANRVTDAQCRGCRMGYPDF